jgi:hypothetical protein
MNRETFQLTCRNAFAQLVIRFDFKIAKMKASSGIFGYDLMNDTTAIRIIYEQREYRAFVQICRLVNHKIAPDPGEIRPESELHCFYVDDLLSLRKPGYQVFSLDLSNWSSYDPQAALRSYAGDLEVYGADVLTGNFVVFEELDRVVKERARQAAYLKWGERAKEFGWD